MTQLIDGKSLQRTCLKCNESKDLTDFYKNKSYSLGYTTTCKVCYRKREQEYRNKNKEEYNTATATRRQKIKLKAIEYKGGKCIDCLQKYPWYVYDFHHENPNEKEYSVGSWLSGKFDKLKKELDKCVLLCANCHRKRHYA